MPVYEQHYHLWQGVPRPRWMRWTVITCYHLRRVFHSKGRNVLVLLLVLSGVIHTVFLAIIYLLANVRLLMLLGVPPSKLPHVNPQFFLAAFVPQGAIVGLLTLIVGAGLIAEDRRDNAIPLYLSKPLTPAEYILGKFGVVGVFALLVTALPINVLFLFEVLMGGGMRFLKEYWWLPLSITAFSAVIMALCGSVILMASSLVKKGGLAGVLSIGLFIGHNALAGILVGVLETPKLSMLSLQFDLHRVALWLFRMESSPLATAYPFSAGEAAVVLSIVIGVSLAIVRWRIRPVEVVR